MYNLLLSLAAGAVVATAIALGTSFGWVAAVFPGLVVATALYVYVAYRIRKRLDAVNEVVQRELQARHIEKAIQALQGGFVLAPWQFLVGSQLHASIGMLRYLTDDLDAAVPELEAGMPKGWLARLTYRDWLARAILAAARYRKRDLAGAFALLEDAVKIAPKEGLAWSAYAWILEKEGKHEEAIRVLGRGAAASPSDEKLKDSQQALQNGRKLKLWKLYGEQWYQFRLEPPRMEIDPAASRSRRQLFRKR
ncbi:MAG TPA: tetratricopeptide repeat protein [Anaeromyxobacteraceae bacterium]|nr:tetratricopeptide repeat protein [Anaeromyxobacteraceae bacterium]